MSEETGAVAPEGGSPEAAPEKEYSPIEQKAMAMGWRPREEFDGDDEVFVDAKEYVGRQPFFEKISSQSKQLKRLEQTVEALKQHHTRVAETEYNRALRDVKAQLARAVEDGDLTAYHAINEKKEELESLRNTTQLQVPQEQEIHPELQAWTSRNSWFTTQPHMKVFAENLADKYKAKVEAGLMTAPEVLKIVEQEVREEFPKHFRNPNKDKPSAVEGNSVKQTRKGADPELSDTERKIMNTLVSGGAITKEKYLADLKAIKSKG